MMISCSLTPEEFEALRRILWAPLYRLTLFNRYWNQHPFFFFGSWIVCGFAAGAMPRLYRPYGELLLFAVWLTIFIPLIRRSQRPGPKLMEKLNADLPSSVSVEDNGISTKLPLGVVSTAPWTAFKSWRDAGAFFFLNWADGSNFLVLPLRGLSSVERETLRATFEDRLGPSVEPIIRGYGLLRSR
ncbi:hypothetical protein [Granulicella rosea]|nr:hypothetical protein [Granulicella rosea]